MLKCIEEMSVKERWDNPLNLTMMASAGMVIKSVQQLIHLAKFAFDGWGFHILDIVSMVVTFNSQLIVCFIFFMMAAGWGTVFKDVSITTFDRRTLVPITIAITSHVLIALLMFYDHEERHKFHEYQGL